MRFPIIVLFSAFAICSSSVKAGELRTDVVKPCVNAYYGIGETVDYAKAYQCFKDQDIKEFIILMTLNGEGTPRDPKLAQADADKWFKGDVGMGEEHQLRLAIRQHLNDPNAAKVDFCKDIAFSMYSIGFCSGIDDALAQQETDLVFKNISDSFSPEQKAQWAKLQDAFGEYQKAEGVRIYQQYADGTIRGVAYDSQVNFVRSNFQQLMLTTFSKKQLKPATSIDVKSLADKVQAGYEGDIKRYVEGVDYLNSPDSSPDEKQEYMQDIADYKQDAETSQKSWETVRELCSTLAADFYRQKGVDWAASMTAALSELRFEEIYNDPVGGG